MARSDKIITPGVTSKLQELGYNVAEWDNSGTSIPRNVKEVFKTASKKKNGEVG